MKRYQVQLLVGAIADMIALPQGAGFNVRLQPLHQGCKLVQRAGRRGGRKKSGARPTPGLRVHRLDEHAQPLSAEADRLAVHRPILRDQDCIDFVVVHEVAEIMCLARLEDAEERVGRLAGLKNPGPPRHAAA